MFLWNIGDNMVLFWLPDVQIVTRMLMEGANGYLDKVCRAEQIAEAIVAVHRNGVYFSELVANQYWKAIKNGMVKLPHLTHSEIQVMKYCCTDLTYEEMAKELGATAASIMGHRAMSLS